MEDQKHYLRPMKGRNRPHRHLLLWVDADDSKPVLKRRSCRAWGMLLNGSALEVSGSLSWDGQDALEAILDQSTKGTGTLTIWLWRGWEDLVLSGLAGLLDCQACTFRYALLDGQKVLIRGMWRGKSIVITSVANWTTGYRCICEGVEDDAEVSRLLTALDAAIGSGAAPIQGEERRFLASVLACASTCACLGCPTLPPSVASAAVQVWRLWLGPRLTVKMAEKKKRTKQPRMRDVKIVAPSPFRPERSRQAERHCAYGLLSRQLRRGLVDELIYVVDMRAAYLLSLCLIPIPLRYNCTLHAPHVDELTDLLQNHTGHALCRIVTESYPYPVRVGRKVVSALGHYWTWLAGSELAAALAMGHVHEVRTAYLWHASHMPADRAERVLAIGPALRQHKRHACAAVWRALYSALIGRFAGRRKIWVDMPTHPSYGRWSEWQRADRRDGKLVQCRSIAGHCQRLEDRTDTSDAVPLVYACVTAHVRIMVQQLAQIAGAGNCICIHADSLWLTKDGWQALQRQVSASGLPPDNLSVKAVYDRAWMSGNSVCVVERKGVRVLRAPGVGDGAVLNEQGRCAAARAVPWSQCETVSDTNGVRRRKVIFAGDRVIRQNSAPAVPLPLGERIDEPLLGAHLLEPVKYGRTVDDE